MKTKSIKRNLSKIVSLLAVVAIGAPAMASIPAAAYIRDNLDPNKTWAAEYESWDAIAEAAADLNIRMAEESITLLKNKDNALPLAKNAKVTVLGRAANNLSQGGGGSGAQTTPTKGASAENNYNIYDALEMAGFEVNPDAKAIYEAGLSGQGNERGSYTGWQRKSQPSFLDLSTATVTIGNFFFICTGSSPYSVAVPSKVTCWKPLSCACSP